MSAALQFPVGWEAGTAQAVWRIERRKWLRQPGPGNDPVSIRQRSKPDANLAFYRKHTESLLRRYLYASMQVGRAPSVLSDPVARGWASSRPIRTFEDAVIFVLDIETCLNKLDLLDREIISRIALQEYTQFEAASMLGISARAITYKYTDAIDRLTENVLDAGILVLPSS